MESKLKLVTINGKEYQLDVEQAEKLGLLKEKDSRVRSWEEFELKYSESKGYYWSFLHNDLVEIEVPTDTNEQLTPHEAKALVAFSKLLKLRRDWIGEWEPDWHNPRILKYCLIRNYERVSVVPYQTLGHIFSFPTEPMAQEFLETFSDLIEEAKTLI